MITLALDASTYVGTVAVLRDGRLLAQGETAMRGRDVERLMPAVAQALDRAGVAAGDVSHVVCGDGPGSFTSLRIAASIAKGIAMGSGAVLLRVSSLALIPAGAADLAAGAYVAVLDALRGEAYFQRFRRGDSGEVDAESRYYLGPLEAVAGLAVERRACIVGPEEVLDLVAAAAGSGGLAVAAVAVAPHARGVAALGRMLETADLAAWEPRYGRLAEAQVKWEAEHGRPLPAS